MANKIIHKRSVITENGEAKLPQSSQLEYGEIAINYASGFETISIKNSSNEIVEFKSKDYFENIIEENELALASSLTNLNNRVSGITESLDSKSNKEHTHGTITLSGDVTGSGTIGSGTTAINITTTVADDSHNHSNYAPKSHASSSTTYGAATTSNYGHVKISNGDVATVASADGLAAGMDHTHSNYSTTGHTHSAYSPTGHTHVSSAITDSISSITDINETATGLVQGKVINDILLEIEDNELVTATAITNLEDRTTNVENGLTNKSDINHTHVSSAITDSISDSREITSSTAELVRGKAVYDFVTDYSAQRSHASTATTYGIATTSNYGHVKIGSGLSVSSGVLSHPTTAGNKHIPSGGTSGQFLKYSSSGTAVWAKPFTYSKNNLTASANTTTSFTCSETIAIPAYSWCHVRLVVKAPDQSLSTVTPFGAKLINGRTIYDMAQGLMMPLSSGSPGQVDMWYYNNTSNTLSTQVVAYTASTNITISSSLSNHMDDTLSSASYYEIIS